ncbi:hypothetical protein TSOC_012178, partial [Tetrabaena socialis]
MHPNPGQLLLPYSIMQEPTAAGGWHADAAGAVWGVALGSGPALNVLTLARPQSGGRHHAWPMLYTMPRDTLKWQGRRMLSAAAGPPTVSSARRVTVYVYVLLAVRKGDPPPPPPPLVRAAPASGVEGRLRDRGESEGSASGVASRLPGFGSARSWTDSAVAGRERVFGEKRTAAGACCGCSGGGCGGRGEAAAAALQHLGRLGLGKWRRLGLGRAQRLGGGGAQLLLLMLTATPLDVSIRQSAAVNFKNVIKYRWVPSEADLYGGAQPLPDAEK